MDAINHRIPFTEEVSPLVTSLLPIDSVLLVVLDPSTGAEKLVEGQGISNLDILKLVWTPLPIVVSPANSVPV